MTNNLQRRIEEVFGRIFIKLIESYMTDGVPKEAEEGVKWLWGRLQFRHSMVQKTVAEEVNIVRDILSAPIVVVHPNSVENFKDWSPSPISLNVGNLPRGIVEIPQSEFWKDDK